MLGFEGRSALVTGAGSGIGRAIGLALAERGSFVWATDTDGDAANATAELIEQAGGHAAALQLDVTIEEQWEQVLAIVDQRDDKLGILVNCAGKSIIADTFTMPLDDLRLVFRINVEGTFLGMKHAIPRIAEGGGGTVVNISSVMGLKGSPRRAAYCGSKAAIGMMTKSVALECADLKNYVRVNSVHPGIVDTPAWHKHGLQNKSGDDPVGRLLDPNEVAGRRVPIGVACSSEEIAEAVAFLASDAARHITGSEIVIDGGMLAGQL